MIEEQDLFECVKCGHRNKKGDMACARCTWPFTHEEWKTTTLRPRRITLDTGCINAKGRNPDLNVLEDWAQTGQIEFQRTDAMLKELRGKYRVQKASSLPAQPKLFTLDVSVLGGPDVLAGPDMNAELRRVLFPTANPLTENQKRDVEHLFHHVRTGGDLFVTLNTNDFIAHGRQDILCLVGIWVVTPPQAVGLLKDAHGWQ